MLTLKKMLQNILLYLAPLLLPAANHIVKIENGKQRFLDNMLMVSKVFSLCTTLDKVQGLQ